MLYPPGNVGPTGINWLVESRRYFKSYPEPCRIGQPELAIRPAVSGSLGPRTEGVPISTGKHVVFAAARGDKVHLELSDGSERCADRGLLGTGYKTSISR